MERKHKPELRKLSWRKIGGGSLRLSNPERIIKPNQVFDAYEHEISPAFRDTIVCLDEEKLKEIQEQENKLLEQDVNFKVAQRSLGWYDVVNAEGKPLNEKPLRKKNAEELLETLLG